MMTTTINNRGEIALPHKAAEVDILVRERVATLEEKVETIKETVKNVEDKLDQLLSLRNQGVGAFWLASALLGTTFIGIIAKITGWFKGVN